MKFNAPGPRVRPGPKPEVLKIEGNWEDAVKLAVAVHFRKDQALRPPTARALAQLILAAQRAAMVTEEESTIPNA